ncbi:MAG TPA: methionine synthase [Tissierellaceae bacterium]|nr:methionine synthase [Tissierellaceae bacterium]
MIKFEINKEEVLRYLFYNNQKIDSRLNTLIDESIEEMERTIDGKSVYKFFQLNREEELSIDGTNIVLKGRDIKRHLENSNSCILIGVSLGHKVDTIIRYYEKLDMTKAIILDSCASVAIEDIINNINGNLETIVSKDKKILTSRYSPGYGDWPLDIQRNILDVLESSKTIGLNLTSHNILIPRKSITAIIGVMDNKFKKIEYNCLNCSKYNDCNFRKGEF